MRPQRSTSNRIKDRCACFTSAPLQEDLEVTGRLMAKLFVTSNVSDTDFVIRLTDVYPDGRSILIADGMHRTAVNSSHVRIGRTFKILVKSRSI